MVLSARSLASARRTAAIAMDSSAAVVTKVRAGDGAGGRKITGEAVGDAFPCSFGVVGGEEGEEFFKAQGKTLYSLMFPHSVSLDRQDVIRIAGLEYDLLQTSCDQTQADIIQHYARMVRR